MYLPTIGLEIHIELNTKTKMFCGCKNDPNEATPNTNVCPVCLAHPGALPTINKQAVEGVIKLGLALGGTIPEHSQFDRKSYFYPDLPKGYQISQYEHPFVKGGKLHGINITRIHLEEDTGRLLHVDDNKSSLVDFNRAGVPLVELVTEPEIKSGEQAVAFAKELQLILRYLQIADADMEKGQMRIEANISISDADSKELGTKVEIKNLNSFKIVGDAIDYEIQRQEKVITAGEDVVQETRGWDEKKQTTKSQREKEEAHDYRYLPEPDLPPLNLTKSDLINVEDLKSEIPELPAQKRVRFPQEYNITPDQAALLVENPRAAQFFEEAVSEIKTEDVRGCCEHLFNYLTSDLYGLIKEQGITFDELKITPENFADLVALVQKGDLTSRMAKDLIPKMQETGDDPRTIMKAHGIQQIAREDIIQNAAEKVLQANKKAVEDYKNGKETALKFLIGKTMAELKGQGNPQIIEKVLTKTLKKSLIVAVKKK